jgi:hypothetical protein
VFDASFGADSLGFYMKMNLVDKYGRTIIIDIREDEPKEKSIALMHLLEQTLNIQRISHLPSL